MLLTCCTTLSDGILLYFSRRVLAGSGTSLRSDSYQARDLESRPFSIMDRRAVSGLAMVNDQCMNFVMEYGSGVLSVSGNI